MHSRSPCAYLSGTRTPWPSRNTHTNIKLYEFFMLFGFWFVSDCFYYLSLELIINPFAVVQIVQDPRRILQNLTLSLSQTPKGNRPIYKKKKIKSSTSKHSTIIIVVCTVFLRDCRGLSCQER